jgi:hypothetical protein
MSVPFVAELFGTTTISGIMGSRGSFECGMHQVAFLDSLVSEGDIVRVMGVRLVVDTLRRRKGISIGLAGEH